MIMFLERVEIPRLKKDGTVSQQITIRYRFKCDHCDRIYDKRPGNVSKSNSGLTFCNNECKFEAFKKTGKMRALSHKTSLTRYGTIHPMLSDVVQEKRKQLFQKRYGLHVTSPLQVPGAKERRKRTHLERYGAEETFQVEEFRQKRNKTWEKNTPNYASKSELRCLQELQAQFGIDDVEHQKWVNGHPIDFYVKSIDTYIQFDGVYWHGLDRPIEIIKESQKPRDRAIARKWEIDRKQNEWFEKHELKLKRITDKDDIVLFVQSLRP